MQVVFIETMMLLMMFVQGHGVSEWQRGPEPDSSVQGLTLHFVPLLLDSTSSLLFCVLLLIWIAHKLRGEFVIMH